jgi:hypothetical protein
MKYTVASAILACIFFAACGPTAKVTSQHVYKDSLAIKSARVIVITDKETRDCMNYYQSFFVDSLKTYGVAAEGTLYCCRDKKTDLTALLDSLSPGNSDSHNILAVVMSKVVTGYGTSSARELQLVLLNVDKHEVTWKGKLSANFSWFISDDNYRAVARKMTNSTLDELKKEQIIAR